MYNRVLNSSSDYKKALGLPLFLIEKILDVAKLIAWIAEPIIKGIGHIMAFPYHRECHLLIGITWIVTSAFLAAGGSVYLAIGVLFAPFGLAINTIEFIKNPNNACSTRLRVIRAWIFA